MDKIKIENLVHRPICQICFVVKDAPKAAKLWADIMGAGPFVYTPAVGSLMDTVWVKSGDKVWDHWNHGNAVGHWGDIPLELLEFTDDNECFVYPPEDGFGRLHHVCWYAEDMEAEAERMEALGCPKVWECTLNSPPGERIMWFDARHIMGCMVEVYEENEAMRANQKYFADLHHNWDGESLFIN